MSAIHCCYLISLFPCIFVSSEALVFFVPDNPKQILAEGNAIKITCIYQADAIPSDELQIKRNGQDLKDFTFTRSGSISAPWNKTKTGEKTNASCEDDGDYTCSYEQEKKHQNISVIRVEHSHSTLLPGKDAVLRCEPRGCSGASNFTKEVSWIHNGKSLMADEKYIIQSSSLVIKNADYSDLGPYQCKIILYHGGEDNDKLIFPIVNVDLTGPPKVTIEGDKNIYVCENHPVRVLCKTEGYPKPDVMWHARLENASEETPHLPKGNQLTIDTFKSIHEGNYTCVATSSMFPQDKVMDSVRILLDGKRHCRPVTEGINLSVIIGAAAAGVTIIILVIVVGILVYHKRKGFCKDSDEKEKSSLNENETGSSKEGNIQLEPKSSNNQHSSAHEPLLPDSTTHDNSVTTPPPKPPRTFSFNKQ